MPFQDVFKFDGENQATSPASQCPPGIDRISQMVADPDIDIADIGRLIAGEISNLIGLMAEDGPLRRRVSQRDLNDRIKAYRELQRTLMESDSLSKRDSLDLDGPKFRCVFIAIINMFKEALKDAGITEQLAQNVMLQFADLVKANDEGLRRDLNRH